MKPARTQKNKQRLPLRERLRTYLSVARRGGTWGGAIAGVVLALVYGAPAAVAWVKHHPYFAVEEITVRGQRRVTRDEVMAWAGIRFGASAWDLDPPLMKERLESEPWVQSADVRVEMPKRVIITIHERKPMAIARLDTLYYVDRRGHLIGPLRDEDSRDYPVITGIDGERSVERARGALPKVAQLVRWCERRKCFDAISEVRVESDHSMTVYPMRPPVAVVFGWGQWREKLLRLGRVLEAYKGNESQLATVDLSNRGIVVVKMKDGVPTSTTSPPKKGTRV